MSTSITTPLSSATLVLETDRSIYAIEVMSARSVVTCVRGTLKDDLERTNLRSMPEGVTEQFFAATNGDLTTATSMAMAAFSEEQFRLHTDEGSYRTGHVSVARWVTNADHILAPEMLSRHTAVCFVQAEGYSQPIPMTTSTCWDCKETVDLTRPGGYTVSRVGGDSRWGYEPWCASCKGLKDLADQVWAEQEVQQQAKGVYVVESEEAKAFFHECERADWYYDFSDDAAMWRRGKAQIEDLKDRASASPLLQMIFDGWKAHNSTGVRGPRPTLG